MEILSTTFFFKSTIKVFVELYSKSGNEVSLCFKIITNLFFFSSFFGGEITFEDLSFVGYQYKYLEVSTLLISFSFSIELK